ncbi:AAA family ATPase [Bacillus sp. FJAT-49705]|uniref:AAA family ATPase n=1 Tax=Cytobacillus citreus TaxID=2833586 RepID=A0ABS5NNM8_9BACI|nr:AAA family ATPase [Cytobacillus citreus]MBS4189416.1 AAA family ATPase [Cytobacillus citreus]
MEKQRQRKVITERIALWKNELRQFGYIEKENEVLSLLGSLDEEEDHEIVSEILTLAALSRIGKSKQDSLGLVWLNKAIKLNSDNQKAAEYLAQFEWSNKESIFNILSFPTLRETDNKQAKMKTAEDILEVCRNFIELAEEEMDELHKKKLKTKDAQWLRSYEKMTEILKLSLEDTVLLTKATEEYFQSIAGVFYNSSYYSEMKLIIDRIEGWKEEWQQLFPTDIDNEEDSVSPLEEVQEMIGLEEVKERVNLLYRFLKYQKERKALGYQLKDELSLHMILTGNPGTGKTSLARLLAKIYHELGVLPRKEVVEADRSQLVGAYVGQTEENVKAIVEKALGGVLFIDEAYSLKREGQTGNDYGQVAIDTLVSFMTSSEYGGKFALILAGYPEEMRQFLDINPGLRSRFPNSNHIHLPDYSNTELILIGEKLAIDNDYIMTEDAKKELEKRIEKERVDDTFGNARSVRNIVLDAIFIKGTSSKKENHILDFTLLEKKDFENIIQDKGNNPKKQLANLIGLESVKNEVNMLLAFVKMQQIRREKGLPDVPIQLHSVFTGNPGTGKTTVAKIYAELLKEYGFLKRGHLIIASRADFVAGYVGQTAIKTKKKIKEALGGVLFIDEAYSLLSSSQGDFGKEVVDTLVDEMTKHNENLVIILAGYPDEMRVLLQSNPGLKSRFKKFFHFSDYSIDELLEIIIKYASNYQYELTQEALEYLKEALSEIQINGNGRFATNLTDEAIQSQALRLISEDKDCKHLKHVSYLEKLDFETALTRIREGNHNASINEGN